MPNLKRAEYPGIGMHITQRGNNRQKIFFEHADGVMLAGLIKRFAEKYQILIHAWCFMPNHIHLFVTPLEPKTIGLFMQCTTATYSRYFNQKYQRTGSLYEKRYFSSLVDEREYVIMLYRYIELNPVTAGLVKRPDQWFWSSYQHNARGRPSTILTPHSCFLLLGEDEGERRRVYRKLVAESDFRSAEWDAGRTMIRTAQRLQSVYGSDKFREVMQVKTGVKLRASDSEEDEKVTTK